MAESWVRTLDGWAVKGSRITLDPPDVPPPVIVPIASGFGQDPFDSTPFGQ